MNFCPSMGNAKMGRHDPALERSGNASHTALGNERSSEVWTIRDRLLREMRAKPMLGFTHNSFRGGCSEAGQLNSIMGPEGIAWALHRVASTGIHTAHLGVRSSMAGNAGTAL